MPLETKSFGEPDSWIKGVVDAANPVQNTTGALRFARNAQLNGIGRLIARRASETVLDLWDDGFGGVQARVSEVLCIAPFMDGALIVAWSNPQSAAYLYWVPAAMNDYYNISKVLQGSNTFVLPIARFWTGMTAPVPVTIAEGLGVAYIAHSNAGASFKTMKLDATALPATFAAFQANLRGAGNEDTYFRGVVSFQQHLWGWGYGSQAANDNDRPELLRFSTPFFGPMAAADNFAVGHRVRSQQEKIVEAKVAGEVLYVGTNFSIWPITGFGRNSWDKPRPVDDSYGFAGIGAACTGPNGYLYYWSHRGPLRLRGREPEPLWPRVDGMVAAVVDDTIIQLGHDDQSDQIIVLWNNGKGHGNPGNSVLGAYDHIREAWLGPDGDIGFQVRCMGFIQSVVTPAPSGPPTVAVTSLVGRTVATASWTAGDLGLGTVSQVEIRIQGTTPWTVVTSTLPSNVQSLQFTNLQPTTAYEWRVKHIRGGVSTAYLGPSGATQFTTALAPRTPTGVVLTLAKFAIGGHLVYLNTVSWTPTGEDADTWIYFTQTPPGGAPASGTLPFQVLVAAPGSSGGGSFGGPTPPPALGTYYAEVQAVANDGNRSSFSGVVSAVWAG